MADSSFRAFSADREAVFEKRPNRFLIIARDGGERLLCHCPNPGRMLELCLPGTGLILERRTDFKDAARKTGWTAVAARYHGGIVPLAPGRMNRAAADLVLPTLFPEAEEVLPEYAIGSSRFDFMIRDAGGARHLVEVKTCSLVEEGVAMFPDAPSLRARRHVEELAALGDTREWRVHVLFLVVHGRPGRLVPNLHTDPGFTAALARSAPSVDIRAALLRFDEDGSAHVLDPELPVDLSDAGLAGEDRGSYLIALALETPSSLGVGSLGDIHFPAGWYVYSGSAQKNLSARVARHLRKRRKGRHWHLDYLTPLAQKIEAFPIASRENLECELAAALRNIGGIPIPGFGSSDCGCPSHLHYFPEPPLGNPRFVETLLYFRHRRALEGREEAGKH